jgi:ApaG protein
MNELKSQSPDSDTTTAGIRVQAAAQYLPDESHAEAPLFLFMYRIVIMNVGTKTAKLLSRHWIIRDSCNEREDVRGAGVVGEYPTLAPGECYEYTSTCPLRTRWGTMEGSYTLEDCADGEMFEVGIGRFFLVPSSRLKQLSAES